MLLAAVATAAGVTLRPVPAPHAAEIGAVDRIEDERLAERPMGVGLAFRTTGQPSDGRVESAFRDFKGYELKS